MSQKQTKSGGASETKNKQVCFVLLSACTNFVPQMSNKKTLLYHLAALFTIIVWGVTMVSTKVLLREGLSPEEIMIIRFIMAYLFLWIIYPRFHRVESWRDELIFIGMGITSGSLYFFFENTALVYTSATNVSLICALIPLLTAIFLYLAFRKSPLSKRFWTGSLISITGTVIVIINGNFSLKFNLFGDFLALMAIVSWSVYGVLIKLLKGSYNTLLVTRKIFLYGILTIAPYFIFVPFDVPLEVLLKPVSILNLCFLGFIASSLCYFFWTLSLRWLGVVKTNNYLYFTPLVTIITADIVLSEQITVYVVCGTALIISGLLIASTKNKKNN